MSLKEFLLILRTISARYWDSLCRWLIEVEGFYLYSGGAEVACKSLLS